MNWIIAMILGWLAIRKKNEATVPPVVEPPVQPPIQPPSPPVIVPPEVSTRPIVQNGFLRTNTGKPLRGEWLAMTYWNTQPERIRSDTFWLQYKQKYHFSAVRLVVYAIPQYRVEAKQVNPSTNLPYTYDTNRVELSADKVIPLLDSAVAMTKKYGLVAVIDYHTLSMWNLTRAKEWWSVIADRYKNESHVVYEISNEPVKQHSDEHFLSADLNYQKEMYNFVHAIAPDTPLIMFSFMTLYSGVENDIAQTGIPMLGRGGKGVVGFHIPKSTQISNVNLLISKGYPLMMTEWSTGGATYAQVVEGYNWKLAHPSNPNSFEAMGWSWLTLGMLPNYPTQPNYLEPSPKEPTVKPIAIRW